MFTLKLIDISHTLDERTPVFPSDTKTALTMYRTAQGHGYNAYSLQCSLHTGTHVDMPLHLFSGMPTCAQYSVDSFMGPGICLDVRGKNPIPLEPAYETRVQPGDIVLLYTGWEHRYAEPAYFFDHPSVSKELAAFFMRSGVKMLGFDLPSPDLPPYRQHKALLEKGIFLLENLRGLEPLLAAERFEVFALPLKISAEASPVRAVCRLP